MKFFSKIMVFVLFALEIGMLQGCESQTQKRFVDRSVSATELMSCSATVYLDQKLAKLRQVFFLKFERCQIP